MGKRLSFLLVVLALLLSAQPVESQEFPFAGVDAYQALLRAGYTTLERFAALLVPSKIPLLADGGGDGGGGSGDGGGGSGGTGDGGDGAASSTTEFERLGFIALGRIEDYAAGIVFRHEQTLAKPKADRLDLLRATRAHFGQIFVVYEDSDQVESLLKTAADPAISVPEVQVRDVQIPEVRIPEVQIKDEYGVVHRVRRPPIPNSSIQSKPPCATKN